MIKKDNSSQAASLCIFSLLLNRIYLLPTRRSGSFYQTETKLQLLSQVSHPLPGPECHPMGNNWKAHSWLPMVLKESSSEVLTQNTLNLGGCVFPTEFNIYSCSGWASLVHLISEVWNRSQQRLSIVGVVGFSQTKACSSLSHASAHCSLAQEATWEVVQLRLWRSKCSFHFTTTGLSQRLCEVFALIGFC